MENKAPFISLSTCFFSSKADNAQELLDEIQKTGVYNLELEYRLKSQFLAQMIPEFKERDLKVRSIHNFCPLPCDIPQKKASGDLFNLASSDSYERNQAISGTIASLELANELEALNLVVHLGFIESLAHNKPLKKIAEQGEITPEVQKLFKDRSLLAGKALDRASFSLEKILKRAEPLGVNVALENRFHLHELPNCSECLLLLRRFEGAPIGHWHDVGHAHIQQFAGLEGPLEWLSMLKGHVLGCHIHDHKKSQDHLPMGKGDVNWSETIKLFENISEFVLEIHPGFDNREISDSAQMLRELISDLPDSNSERKDPHENSGGGSGHGKGQFGAFSI